MFGIDQKRVEEKEEGICQQGAKQLRKDQKCRRELNKYKRSHSKKA